MVTINLITLDSCSACHHFLSDEWNGDGGLEEILKSKGHNVVHYDISRSNRNQWGKDNPMLAQYVSWFPELIAVKDNGSVDVFASTKLNGRLKYDGVTEYNKKAVLNWLETL